MLEAVLGGKAALNGVTSFQNMLFWGLLLLISGGSLLLAGLSSVLRARPLLRRTGMIASLLILGAGALLIGTLTMALLQTKASGEKLLVKLDLRTERKISQIDSRRCSSFPWGDERRQRCSYDGTIDLELLLPGDLEISEAAARGLMIQGDMQNIREIQLISAPISLEEARQKAQQYIKAWRLSDDLVKAWEGTGAPLGRHMLVSTTEQKKYPTLEILAGAIDNPRYAATPWYLTMNIRLENT